MSDDERPGPTAPDPTERFDDPVEELVDVPAVEEPSVENPADRLPDPHEVDADVRRQFWGAVLWLDVALAGVTLGPAYALLEGGTTVGTLVTVLGLLAGFRVYQTYRAFQRRDTDGDAGGADDTDGDRPDGDDRDSDATDGVASVETPNAPRETTDPPRETDEASDERLQASED